VLYHDECDLMSQLALPAFAKTIRNRLILANYAITEQQVDALCSQLKSLEPVNVGRLVVDDCCMSDSMLAKLILALSYDSNFTPALLSPRSPTSASADEPSKEAMMSPRSITMSFKSPRSTISAGNCNLKSLVYVNNDIGAESVTAICSIIPQLLQIDIKNPKKGLRFSSIEQLLKCIVKDGALL
jgi:hypothetical protein